MGLDKRKGLWHDVGMSITTIETPDQAKAAILDMLAANNREEVLDWIKTARNVEYANIDDWGNVYVGKPQCTWLGGTCMVSLVNAINAGV